MNPNNISWLHYQDIQLKDVSLRKQFDDYMNTGMYKEAIDLLNGKKEQIVGKAYIADTITTITNGIIELESQFNVGVNLFLSKLAQQHLMLVDNLRKMGDWDANVEYIPYNFVVYDNEVYMNINSSPKGTFPTDDQFWLKLGLRGAEGTPGVDVTLKYAWDDTRRYNKRDLVSYNGNLYIAIQDNFNTIPGTDKTIWLEFLLINKGKINVTALPPVNPENNTIWVNNNEVSKDKGQFFRYSNGQWEEMYPTTVSTWVEELDTFSPLLKRKYIRITPNNWELDHSLYKCNYIDYDVTEDSNVQVYPATGLSYMIGLSLKGRVIYNSLSLEIQNNKIIFTAKIKPTVQFDFIIDIQ